MKNQLQESILFAMLAILGLSDLVSAQSIVVGDGISLSICSSGKLNSWGSNTFGQLGNGGTSSYSYVPVEVNSLTGVIAIASGATYFLALKNDNTVWSWGNNFFGMLGDGTTTNRNVPVQLTSITGIISINAFASHALALKSDGTIWTWGLNSDGQLGTGTNTNSNIPVMVSSLTSIVAVAGGTNHSLAVSNNGDLWAWGRNGKGQLGNGTQTNSNSPIQVTSLTGVTAVEGGNEFSLALKNDGTVWAWGYNNYGQLGNGTQTNSKTPIQVSSLSGIIAIAGGSQNSLALKNDGTVWAWGYNSNGSLGTGTNLTSNPVPAQVTSTSDIIAIAAGYGHSLARKNDGTVWAWGGNFYGQLGTGNLSSSEFPILVTSLCGNVMGVQENSIDNNIYIYPNPCNEQLFVELTDLSIGQTDYKNTMAEIFNIQGQLLQSIPLQLPKTTIQINNLASGSYLIQVKSPLGTIVKKIVKN